MIARAVLASRTEVLTAIREHLVARDVEADRIVESAHFVNDLWIDSLDLQTLAQELEDCFGCRIGMDDAARIETVGQAIDFVVGTPAVEGVR